MFKTKIKSENSKNGDQQFLLFTFKFLLFNLITPRWSRYRIPRTR